MLRGVRSIGPRIPWYSRSTASARSLDEGLLNREARDRGVLSVLPGWGAQPVVEGAAGGVRSTGVKGAKHRDRIPKVDWSRPVFFTKFDVAAHERLE